MDKDLEKAEKKVVKVEVPVAPKKPILIVSKPLKNGQYLSSIEEKKSIFLHHTAGTTAKGAMDWWDQTPERVGTAFVIERDGTIYQCFDPQYHAYHLGVKGDDDWQEKHSVGIEIVAAGPLRGGIFYPLWPSKASPKAIPADDIIAIKGGDYDGYHKYTDAQVSSVCQLVEHLKELFPSIELPKQMPSLKYDSSIVKEHKPGIWAHSNVRADKNDIFPQPSLITALNTLLKALKA